MMSALAIAAWILLSVSLHALASNYYAEEQGGDDDRN